MKKRGRKEWQGRKSNQKKRFAKKGCGLNVGIHDNSNGWPALQAPGVMQAAMNHGVNSHDLEANAKTVLHSSARDFNVACCTFPGNLISRRFGISPWRYPSGRSFKPRTKKR